MSGAKPCPSAHRRSWVSSKSNPAPFPGDVRPTFTRGLSETIGFTPAGGGDGERAEIEEPD